MEEGQIVWTIKATCPECGKANARRVKGPGYAALACRSCRAITDVLAQKLRIGPNGPVPVAPAPPRTLPTLVRRQRAATARRRVWGGVTGIAAGLILCFVLFVVFAPAPAAEVGSTSVPVTVSVAVDGEPAADVSFVVELWMSDAQVASVNVTRLANATAIDTRVLGEFAQAPALVRVHLPDGKLLAEAPLELSKCGERATVRISLHEDGAVSLDSTDAC